MHLSCDQTVALGYKSPSQRARVISELWFERNGYCLACSSGTLNRSTPNTVAMDFSCNGCGHRYELKTFLRRPLKSLVDGAYASLILRITSGVAPTLCLLERSEAWTVTSLTAIHSSFLTPGVVEERRPLGPSARRAGWVGCNIRLDRIPSDGFLTLVGNGREYPREEARRSFKRFIPLSGLSANERGWTILTLRIVRELSNELFTLDDLYMRESDFHAAYPKNRHIREKIRQQLQILRDLGVIAFEKRGKYRLVA